MSSSTTQKQKDIIEAYNLLRSQGKKHTYLAIKDYFQETTGAKPSPVTIKKALDSINVNPDEDVVVQQQLSNEPFTIPTDALDEFTKGSKLIYDLALKTVDELISAEKAASESKAAEDKKAIAMWQESAELATSDLEKEKKLTVSLQKEIAGNKKMYAALAKEVQSLTAKIDELTQELKKTPEQESTEQKPVLIK